MLYLGWENSNVLSNLLRIFSQREQMRHSTGANHIGAAGTAGSRSSHQRSESEANIDIHSTTNNSNSNSENLKNHLNEQNNSLKLE